MRGQWLPRRSAVLLTSSVIVAGASYVGVLGACSSFSADGAVDAGPDAPAADTSPRACDTDSLFQTPSPVDSINDALDTGGARLTSDELTVYFSSARGGTEDLYVATRASTTAPFGTPQRIEKLSTTMLVEDYPSISTDRRFLFFSQAQPLVAGSYNLFFSTIDDAGTFAAASALGETTAFHDLAPFVASNGDVYFTSDARTGFSFDIYRLQRKANAFDFEPRELLATVSSEQSDSAAVLSADLLTMYLASNRPGSKEEDIWVAHRQTPSGDFGAPERVENVSSATADVPSWLSPDNCRLYLTSKRGGPRKVYVAARVQQ